MKIELRNVKINENQSEETIAFTGELYANDLFVGYAQNSGHGESNSVATVNQAFLGQVSEFVLTLPPIEVLVNSWTKRVFVGIVRVGQIFAGRVGEF